MAVYVQTNQAITLNDINDNILTSENGRIFLIPVLTGNRTYTLPAIQPGLHYVFINRALAANNAI